MGHPVRVDILWHKYMLTVFGFLFYRVVCVVMPCYFERKWVGREKVVQRDEFVCAMLI